MIRSRTLLAAAIALAVVACTDTPTEPVDGLAFAKPASSGVVVRDVVNSFLVIFDLENDLRATVGFDREKWCGDGNGPVGSGNDVGDEYRTDHDRQITFAANGQGSINIHWNGILSVYEEADDDRLLIETVTDCTDGVLLGLGTGHTRFHFTNRPGPSDLTSDNMNGFITVDDERKRVNARFTHLDGIRMNPDALFHEFNSKIIVR